MFLFRTEYRQSKALVKNPELVADVGNTYSSYVLAKDEKEALVKITNRKIDERLTRFSDPIPVEELTPRDLVNALDFFDKKQYNYCLHAITFMVYVLGKSGRIDPLEAISDIGVIHTLIHFKSYPHLCSETILRESIVTLQEMFYELSH